MLETSTVGELATLATRLGLAPTGDLETLRQRLFDYYGIVPIPDNESGPVVSIEEGFILEVVIADRMMTTQGDRSLIILEGNVQISFQVSPSEKPKELKAGKIVLDLDRKQLSAIGSVDFRDTQGNTIEHVEGDVVTLRWDQGDILISNGLTSTERKNSEDENVEFYTSGERITYAGDRGAVLFENGVITTNKNQAYFSISAEKLLLIDGGDMFVQKALISIGRVPLLWIPFLFYPGQTFIFNPAFGYDADRGLFFSTTTELYGSYGKIQKSDDSSFTTLLSTNTEGERIQDGMVYTQSNVEDNQKTLLDTWAGKSGSYFAILADTYQEKGTFIGIDTANYFKNKQYAFTLLGALAWCGDLASELSSTTYGVPTLRYVFDGDVKIDTENADFLLSLPFYSDPKMMRDYGNRLTSFSVGALSGNEDFPTTYLSDITSFTWDLSGSLTIPTKMLAPFIESFTISQLDSDVEWKAVKLAYGTGYTITSATVPEINATLSGTLFSFRKSYGESTGNQTETVAAELILPSKTMDSTLDLDTFGIAKPYNSSLKAATEPKETITYHSISLGYTLNQVFSNYYELDDLSSTSNSLYSKTQGTITLKGTIAPSWFTFSEQLTPLHTLAIETSSSENTEDSTFQLNSTTKASVPFLGLSYTLVARLYTKSTEEEGEWGSWDSNTITSHQLSFTQPINLESGKLTLSLTGVLPPRDISLTPKITYSQNNFSTSLAYLFNDDGTGTITSDTITHLLSFDSKYFETNLTTEYDMEMYLDSPDSHWAPLSMKGSTTVRLFDEYLNLSQSFDYTGDDNTFNSLISKVKIPWASVSLSANGAVGEVEPVSLDFSTDLKGVQLSWWRGRINFGFDLLSEFHYGIADPDSTNLSVTTRFDILIPEFLSISFDLTSVNKGFYSYDSFSELFKDLMESFDFFGSGRKSTHFNMESISFEVVHYMEDWDLHCKYTGSVVLSDSKWTWTPEFTIYLKWKAIPEIKIDETF
ncbi:MAG: hypothetical protein AB9828_10255 [Sphaerochaetaceae bacterium]